MIKLGLTHLLIGVCFTILGVILILLSYGQIAITFLIYGGIYIIIAVGLLIEEDN